MRRSCLPLAVLAFASASAADLAAQDEASLRQALEGTRVTLTLDMPATTEGVDVFPGTSRPLDFQKYGARIKKFGTAIETGQAARITKVKVRGEHIEIQLDGGGFGTFGDALNDWSSTAGADSGAAQQAKVANDRTTRLSAGSRSIFTIPAG